MSKSIEAWKDLKFGMFIHWGLYALLGRGEWAMYTEAIDKDEYRQLMNRFSADRFDAEQWAKTAKAAGMKYIVLTARHHDGFSLWDSKSSYEQFTAMHSAAHRDFIKEYVDACRKAGLKVGLYYSPLDWRFPGYFFPRMYAQSAMELREQCHNQLRELLTQYGKIDILWFDGGEDYWLCHGRNLHVRDTGLDYRKHPQCPGFWDAAEMDRMVRTLQPGIVVNNRTGNREFGDFLTPEAEIGEFNLTTPWESCMTINGFWGWVPDKPAHSLRKCVQMLVKAATGGGNLLLNIGPKADGAMEANHVARLLELGEWLQKYGDSIYNTRGGPWKNNQCSGTTYNGNVLYMHIWDWPENEIILRPIEANILSVTSPTALELRHTMADGKLVLSVSAQDRLALDTIIRIELDRPVSELTTEEKWCAASGQHGEAHSALIADKV